MREADERGMLRADPEEALVLRFGWRRGVPALAGVSRAGAVRILRVQL